MFLNFTDLQYLLRAGIDHMIVYQFQFEDPLSRMVLF